MSANEELSGSDGGWIEWGGGECPVADGVLVDMKFRDGVTEIDRADVYFWAHDEYEPDFDIIAYRIVGA